MSHGETESDTELQLLPVRDVPTLEASREVYIRPPAPQRTRTTPSVLCPGRDSATASGGFSSSLGVLILGFVSLDDAPEC